MIPPRPPSQSRRCGVSSLLNFPIEWAARVRGIGIKHRPFRVKSAAWWLISHFRFAPIAAAERASRIGSFMPQPSMQILSLSQKAYVHLDVLNIHAKEVNPDCWIAPDCALISCRRRATIEGRRVAGPADGNGQRAMSKTMKRATKGLLVAVGISAGLFFNAQAAT